MAVNATPLLDQPTDRSTQPKDEASVLSEPPKNNNNEMVATTFDGINKEEGVVYHGGFRNLVYFKFFLLVSLVQLGVYLNKLFEDSSTTSLYFQENEFKYFIVSAMCLILPAVTYSIYLVGRYLKNERESIKCSSLGTLFIRGLLLIPWQVKSHVDILHFLSPRVCRSKTSKEEKLKIKELERNSAFLEFFENVYAGLLQLLLQLYITLVALGNNTESQTLIKCIVASVLSLVVTIVAAVRRKDDGPLSFILSFLGWCFIFASKIIAMAMATSVIHHYMAAFVGIHGILMSFWITYIAVKSYSENNSKISLSVKNKVGIYLMVFVLFGLPSLCFWPIMFQLKQHNRPLIFLIITFFENALLFALWFVFKSSGTWSEHEIIFVALIFGGCLLGGIFIKLYICWKPSLTDQVVIFDMKVANANSYGLLFEFCDETFLLPRDSRVYGESSTEKASEFQTPEHTA